MRKSQMKENPLLHSNTAELRVWDGLRNELVKMLQEQAKGEWVTAGPCFLGSSSVPGKCQPTMIIYKTPSSMLFGHEETASTWLEYFPLDWTDPSQLYNIENTEAMRYIEIDNDNMSVWKSGLAYHEWSSPRTSGRKRRKSEKHHTHEYERGENPRHEAFRSRHRHEHGLETPFFQGRSGGSGEDGGAEGSRLGKRRTPHPSDDHGASSSSLVPRMMKGDCYDSGFLRFMSMSMSLGTLEVSKTTVSAADVYSRASSNHDSSLPFRKKKNNSSLRTEETPDQVPDNECGRRHEQKHILPVSWDRENRYTGRT